MKNPQRCPRRGGDARELGENGGHVRRPVGDREDGCYAERTCCVAGTVTVLMAAAISETWVTCLKERSEEKVELEFSLRSVCLESPRRPLCVLLFCVCPVSSTCLAVPGGRGRDEDEAGARPARPDLSLVGERPRIKEARTDTVNCHGTNVIFTTGYSGSACVNDHGNFYKGSSTMLR